MVASPIGRAELFVVMLSLAVTAGWLPKSGPRLDADEPAQPAPRSPKLQTLLTERVATLREVSRLAGLRFKNHEGFEELREANRMLLEAELELCDSAKDRVGVLEKHLIQAKEFERIAERFANTGQFRTGAALTFKADRLQVEIALERAKAKAGAGKK